MIRGVKRSDIEVPAGYLGLFPDLNGNWKVKDENGVISGLSSDFGTDRASIKRTDETNSTSNTFQDYSELIINNTSPGNKIFEVLVTARWAYASASNDGIIIVELNGSDIPESEMRSEPKDPGTDQRNIYSYADDLTLLPGSNTIKIKYRASNNGTQFRMHSSFIRGYKV